MKQLERNLYTIAPNYAFVDALCEGVCNRYPDMSSMTNMLILLPNRRSCQALKDAFLRNSKGQATLLPRMIPLGDLDEEEIGFSLQSKGQFVDVAPAISSMRQQWMLARLTHQWRQSKYGQEAAFVHSLRLAGELVDFLSEVEKEQLSFSDLERLYPEEFQAHWQDTLDFLTILMKNWPDVLQEQGVVSVAQHRNQLLALQAKAWEKSPPNYPVIAAGTTGTVPATANLLRVIASLEKGMVVLPGLDKSMDNKSWDAISETHPQYNLKKLISSMGASREDIKDWGDSNIQRSCLDERVVLISELMRPAHTTDTWLNYVVPPESYQHISQVEARSLHDEAGMIAVMLRQVLETPGKTAALVTHDRSLAKYVIMTLKRWDIEVDDSAGKPLSQTPLAVFIRLVAGLLEENTSVITLLACIKHPYVALGYTRQEHLQWVRKLETTLLRGVCNARTAHALRTLLQRIDNTSDVLPFLNRLCDVISPLEELRQSSQLVTMSVVFDTIIDVAQNLATSDKYQGAERLWDSDAAEQLQNWYQEFHQIQDVTQKIRPGEAAGILEVLLERKSFHPRFGMHPRLHILGPIEARLQPYDVLILGGLNEGSWPSLSAADPWMSRPMRSQFGLPLPERRIGQAAHDFAQYMCAKEVILTRSRKVDGAEASPSRWWLRLNTVLHHANKEIIFEKALYWSLCASQLYTSEHIKPLLPPRPEPPISLRPRLLSATRVQILQQNPYAIYARYILNLRALEPLDKTPGVLEFGNFIHAVAERFAKRGKNQNRSCHDNTEDWLSDAHHVFEEQFLPESIKVIWWPRVERIAKALAAIEKEREPYIKEQYSEETGRWSFESDQGIFTLTAKADRLELDHDNKLHVIDYKTGSVPESKRVMSGRVSQLPLEALIAIRGGFSCFSSSPSDVAELSYWQISGRKKPLEERPLRQASKDAAIMEALLQEAQEGLKALVAWFDKSDSAYLAYPFGRKEIQFDDYEHLIREEEWLV
jgi:ATP-dependent helicase/nuclease subunit B